MTHALACVCAVVSHAPAHSHASAAANARAAAAGALNAREKIENLAITSSDSANSMLECSFDSVCVTRGELACVL